MSKKRTPFLYNEIDSSRMGMLGGLNDFAHSQWKHLKMSALFAAGAIFPTLAYASTPGSELGMAFVVGAAAIGYVVSIADSNDPNIDY
jgi:VIT1/CCC1 family predicted Fe2+/Mn2+ transporter